MPGGVLTARRFEIGLIAQQPDFVAVEEIGGQLGRLFLQQPAFQFWTLPPQIFAKIPMLAVLQNAGLQP